MRALAIGLGVCAGAVGAFCTLAVIAAAYYAENSYADNFDDYRSWNVSHRGAHAS